MKDFVKTLLAVITGLFIFGILLFVLSLGFVGSIAALSSSTPTVAEEGVLSIDLSTVALAEQSKEYDFNSMMNRESRTSLGLWSAVKAINAAAADPGIKFIYLRPDGVSGGIAQVEELRKALNNFRSSGKAVIAYTENPSNGSYYLASVADKVYVSASQGGMSTVTGLASQMFFLKDILDKLGINMQLIRHGKYKSAGEMYIRNSISDENREQNEVMLNSIWDSWVADIAESRHISADKFKEAVNSLELVEPEDFVKNGLADAALTREERIEKICTLYMTDKLENVNFIPLQDYAAVNNTKIDFKAPQVAVLFADGQIVDGYDDYDNVAGDRFAETIASLRKDENVKAVVLRVSSPGGSVLASDKIKKELDLLAEAKPLVASYGNYAASGGYWISANCPHIFSDATTLTGSIGVFSMIPDFSKTVKNIAHVNCETIKTGAHSDMYSGMRPLDNDEKAYLQKSVEDIYDRFTSIVAEGRHLDKDFVDSIAQGRVWTGADGKEIGLVDEIGTLDDAVRYAAGLIDETPETIRTEEYPKQPTALEQILNSIQGKNTPKIFAGTPLESVEECFRNISIDQSGKAFARIPYEIVIE